MPKVAVVGGSVGGLTAALVLADLGCDVDVYERSTAELEARGAGIVLHPVTVRYFEEHRPLDVPGVMVRLPWLRFLDRGRRHPVRGAEETTGSAPGTPSTGTSWPISIAAGTTSASR